MTYADHSFFGSRIFGVASSIAIHATIGLALLLPVKGPGGERAKQNGSESFVVELLPPPLPPGGSASRRGISVERVPNGQTGKETAAGHTARPVGDSAKPGLGPPPQGTTSGTNEPGPEATDEARTGARAVSGSELQNFRTRLLRHIEQYRRYPEDARGASIQGVAQVHFVMDHDGRITSIWIETSSGSMLLDEAAVAAVMRATPLPAPPATWPASVAVTLPIEYSLQ